MSDILVISGHPDYKNSHANRAILDEFHKIVPQADIVYLDALYPDFKINVEEEQKRLVKCRTLIFEFPFWWFGYPSLLHRYVEDIFTYGFAYGSNGNALQEKNFIASFTTGASEKDYSPAGKEAYSMQAYLPPIIELANFTGMIFKGTVISYEMALLNPQDVAMREKILSKAKAHALKLANLAQ